MIPWLVVGLVERIAARFGYATYVRRKSGAWGAERIYFMRLQGDEVPVPPLTKG